MALKFSFHLSKELVQNKPLMKIRALILNWPFLKTPILKSLPVSVRIENSNWTNFRQESGEDSNAISNEWQYKATALYIRKPVVRPKVKWKLLGL